MEEITKRDCPAARNGGCFCDGSCMDTGFSISGDWTTGSSWEIKDGEAITSTITNDVKVTMENGYLIQQIEPTGNSGEITIKE